MTTFRNVDQRQKSKNEDGNNRGCWIGTPDVSAVSETSPAATCPAVGFGAWYGLGLGTGGDIRADVLDILTILRGGSRRSRLLISWVESVLVQSSWACPSWACPTWA